MFIAPSNAPSQAPFGGAGTKPVFFIRALPRASERRRRFGFRDL